MAKIWLLTKVEVVQTGLNLLRKKTDEVIMKPLCIAMKIILLSAALTLFIQIMVGARVHAAASETDLILLDARQMDASEEGRAQALERLKKRPRAQVVSALRELLMAKETQHAALGAIRALDASETLPDLLKLSEKSDDWHLYSTVNHLLLAAPDTKSRTSFTKIYLTRAQADVSAPTKMAILDGLANVGAPIPEKLFSQLLHDPSDDVRESAVRQFLASHKKLTSQEQTRRFRESFHAKPYQVRLPAMEYFSRLPLAERSRLASAIDKKLCQEEPKAQVKVACEKMLKGGALGDGKGGAKGKGS